MALLCIYSAGNAANDVFSVMCWWNEQEIVRK